LAQDLDQNVLEEFRKEVQIMTYVVENYFRFIF
jgi:hypothetical protein